MASTSAILLWGEAVADLDELSIDNLKCGRITKEVMNYAIKHVTQKGKNHIVDWRLADFLNDLLEVGREKSDINKPVKIDDTKYPPVLDACCGPRGMWFDKRNPLAMFTDRRTEVWDREYPSGRKTYRIEPDIEADFTDLPFPDNTFELVVMDPPHIEQGANTGCIVRQYGMLTGEWREMLRRGFAECFRVLRPEGTLIIQVE